MRQNIVYFSGTHGTGKTTLINTLAERYPEKFQIFEKLKIPKNQDTYERTKIRTTRSYHQTFYQEQQAAQQPDKVLLCDRCINDEYGYMMGFLKLDMVSKTQFEEFLRLCETLFKQERRPHNIVYIDLPLEILIRNIKKRWETEPRKWREDNFSYLDAVRIGYREFYKEFDGNILHLQIDDLEERVNTVLSWIDRSICQTADQRVVGQA